jgi:hypothetical protein
VDAITKNVEWGSWVINRVSFRADASELVIIESGASEAILEEEEKAAFIGSDPEV